MTGSEEQVTLEPETEQVPNEVEGAAPETVESETPEPVEGSEGETPVGREDGRDERGRFAAKAPPEGAAPVEGEPPPPPFEPVPFKVRQGRAEHEVIPGALIREDGLFIPKDHIEKAHQMFGRALEFEQRRQETREQVLRARQAESSAKATEQALGSEIQKLFDIASMQNEEEMAIAAVQYILDLRQSRPILEERVALNREKAEMALQRELSAPEPEVVREQIVQQVTYTAQEELRSLLPYLEGLTEEDQQLLLQRVIQDPERYAYRVGQHPNAREREAGVAPGQIVFDRDTLIADAQLAHQYRQRLVSEAKQREAAVKATANNTQRLAAPAAPPPPAPKSNTPTPIKLDPKAAGDDYGARRDAYLRSVGMMR